MIFLPVHLILDSANQSLLHLNLTELEKHDLSSNDFEHSLTPSWFWKATSLKYLDLRENRLFGQFPHTLANMTYLQVLDTSCNENTNMMLTGNLLKNICSLEILDLLSKWHKWRHSSADEEFAKMHMETFAGAGFRYEHLGLCRTLSVSSPG